MRLVPVLSGTSLIFKKKNYIIEQRHCEFAKLRGSNFNPDFE